MATAKPTKKSKPVARKPQSKTRLDGQVVVLKKMATDDELPLQAVNILKVLKSASGKLPAKSLVERMKGQVESKQSMMAIWSFYRKRLIGEHYVAVEKHPN